METRSAAIHRKMAAPPLQLPITGSAHKAAVVRNDGMGTVLAARNMAAESRGPAALDRAHDLELGEAHMAAVGLTPSGPVVAEDVRDLQSWPCHDARATPAARPSSDQSG